MTNSTFSGNAAGSDGGGIYNNAGSLTVNNSTLSGNTASMDGGGIFNAGSGPTLNNSIVAGNTANGSLGSDDCDGCGTQSSNNLIGGTPQLAPLGWYGGPTQTMLPLPGSSQVIGKGTATATDSPDQRGFARPTTGSVDLGAVQTNYLIVITTADTSDATPGCDAKRRLPLLAAGRSDSG